jgi:GT2 family glycosyltransferase
MRDEVLVKPDLFNPRDNRVDIIIPFHAQYQKVVRLLESLVLYTHSNPFTVTLVDDASPNNTFGSEEHANLSKINVKIIRNEEQIGFGASLLEGYKATNNPWVVFLHSDCRVTEPNWLKNMGITMQKLKGSGIKMVGARSNNPGPDADPRMKADAGHHRIDDFVLGNDDYLPLYCVLVHRKLFDLVGGFIRPYPYVGYEDQELAHRLRKFGYKQAVCGGSWVFHEGGGTLNDLVKIDPRINLVVEEDNRDLCIKHIRALSNTKAQKKPQAPPPKPQPPKAHFNPQPQPKSPSPVAGTPTKASEARSVADLIAMFGDGSR